MDDVAEVIAAAEARARALGEADAARLNELLHEHFTWTSHRGETFDRSEYVRRNTEGHTVWRSQTLLHPEVTVVGDTAVLRAEAADEIVVTPDVVETFRMPVTLVWVRADGRWRCLAGHAGPRRA